MIGFLTSIPSAIFFSVAQQILCSKETRDANPSPGDHFSFDSLLTSLSKVCKAIAPSQKAPMDALSLVHTTKPESFRCDKDLTGKDAQAPPARYKNMSWYSGLQGLQVPSLSPSFSSDIPVEMFSKYLFAGEGKGEIQYKTDTGMFSQHREDPGCFSTPCITSLRLSLHQFLPPFSKGGYLQDFLKNNKEDIRDTSTEFEWLHAKADMNSTPADRTRVIGTEHRYSAPEAEIASEIKTGFVSQRSMKITHTPASPLLSREGLKPEFTLIVKGDWGGYSFLSGEGEGDISGSTRNNAHLLQEWFTISDEQTNGRGAGIVPGAFMRQGNDETKEDANASSVHNIRHSIQDNIPSAHIVTSESLQREGTHGVRSVSPGVNRDVAGFPDEKIHLIKSGNTITIHIEPEGLGKLNIHLNLEKGMLHTLINASHDTVRDFLREQSLHIMNTLMQDGLNVGSFSVSLRGGGMGWEPQMSRGRAFSKPSEEKESEPVQDTSRGLISIFV